MSSGRILYRRIVQMSTVLSAQGSNLPPSVTTQTAESGSDQDLSATSASPQAPPLLEIKGIIFDMDGTLTVPVLKFSEMRSRLGLSPNQDILPTVQGFPPDKRAWAMAIIEEMEEEGVRLMQLQPGVLDLLHFVAERGVQRALMTRNSTKAAQVFLRRLNDLLATCQERYPHLKQDNIFSQVITRDYEPCKPDPSPALHVCNHWQLDPEQVAFVGDDKTDMICGIRAGTGVNILLRNDRNKSQVDYSNFKVDSLSEIVTLFSSPLDVLVKTYDV